jgi:cytochrome oxidase Cu insertion factor (SCO1/SenC/PrrC family)
VRVLHLRKKAKAMFKQRVSNFTTKGALGPWLLYGGGVLLVVATLLVATQLARRPATSTTNPQGPAPYLGTNLQGAPAPDFTLRDQTGASISLQQYRGHPVVLTFFDSVCPHDDCSLMAEYINATAKDLSQRDASSVAWLALSLNPWHDTPASAATFLKTRQVSIPLHYLLGTEKTLAPIWSAYHMQSILQPDGIVIHSTGLYLIDSSGREQTFFEEGFDPKVVSQQIHQLLTASSTIAQPTGVAGVTSADFTATATEKGYRVEFTAAPGEFGTYDFTVTVLDPEGAPLQGAHATLDLTMPAMAMSPLTVTLSPTNPPIPGSYQARGVLSMAGAWQAVVKITPNGSAQRVTATFTFTSRF